MDPVGRSTLYRAINQLYDTKLKDAILEVVPEEAARESEQNRLLAASKSLGKFVWNRLYKNEPDEINQIANKIVRLKLLEKINQLNALQTSYNAVQAHENNEDMNSQVKRLADGDALYAQKLEIADALMKILSDDPYPGEAAIEPNSLLGRISQLKTDYQLQARAICIETATYSATRDIFNAIFTDPARSMPPIPFHAPTLGTADTGDATELQMTSVHEKINVYKRALASGLEPKSGSVLTEEGKEKLNTLVLNHQNELIRLITKERERMQNRLASMSSIVRRPLHTKLQAEIAELTQWINELEVESADQREKERRISEIDQLEMDRVYDQGTFENRLGEMYADYEQQQGDLQGQLKLQALRDNISKEELSAKLANIGHEKSILEKKREHIQNDISALSGKIGALRPGQAEEKNELERQRTVLQDSRETFYVCIAKLTQDLRQAQIDYDTAPLLANLHEVQSRRIQDAQPGPTRIIEQLKLEDINNQIQQNQLEFHRKRDKAMTTATILAKRKKLEQNPVPRLTIAQTREYRILEEGIRIEESLHEHADAEWQQKIAKDRLRFLEGQLPKLQAALETIVADAQEQGIAAATVAGFTQEITELERAIERRDMEIRAKIQDLNERRVLLNAKAQLLKGMTPAEQQQRLSKDGNYLSSTIDRSIQGLIRGTDTDWQNEEWMQFLFKDEVPIVQGVAANARKIVTAWGGALMGNVTFKAFQKGVNAHKIKARELETLKNDKDGQIQELERLRRELPSSSVPLENRLAAAEKYENEIKVLTYQWRELDSESRWVELAIRGAFVQRITAETKRRYIEQRQIAANQKRVEALRAPNSPLNEEDTLTIEGLNEKMLENLRAIEALERGFMKQIQQYTGIEPPGELIFKRMATAAMAGIMNPRGMHGLLKEIFVPQRYSDPNQLQALHSFARLGYTYEEGWAEYGQIEHYGTFVEEFLRFADRHPETAEAIAGDLAVTIGSVGGKGFMDQILQGMDWRRRLGLGLGNVRRSAASMEKSDFKFLALAEAAQYGPTRIAQLKGLWTVATHVAPALLTFSPAAVMAAGTIGVANAAIDFGKVQAIQGFVQGAKQKDLQAWSMLLQLANSQPVTEILKEQSTLASLEMFGMLKDLIIRPRALLERFRDAMSNAWKILKKSAKKSDRLEFGLRLVTTVVAPTVLVSAAVLLLIFSGPIGLAAAIGAAIGCMSIAGLSSRFFYDRLNSLYPSTVLALQQDNAKEFLRDHNRYRTELTKTRNEFISSLQRDHMLSDFRVNADMSPAASGLQTAIDLLRADFESLLAEELQVAKRLNRDLPIAPEKVISIYNKVYQQFGLTAKCVELSARAEFPDKAAFARDLEVRVVAPLFARVAADGDDQSSVGVIMKRIDDAFESQFLFEVASYPTPQEFSRKTAEHKQKLKEAQERLQAVITERMQGGGAAVEGPAWENVGP